jgi:hypothetical protein
MSKEEKEKLKEKKDKEEEIYKFALVDGKEQPTGNFRIEPPGIFLGRGCHPLAGKIKERVFPEDIIINIDEKSKIPPMPSFYKNHNWKDVIHDNTLIWLASWKDNITGKMKYVWLGAKSDFKAKCLIMHELMNDPSTKVYANDVNEFWNYLLATGNGILSRNIYIFGLDERFYTNPKYMTFMRAICNIYCDVSFDELLEIGNNHGLLVDIMIKKTMGNKYNTDIINVKDYTYHTDTTESEEKAYSNLDTFKMNVMRIGSMWAVIEGIIRYIGTDLSIISSITSVATGAKAVVSASVVAWSSWIIGVSVLLIFGFVLFMGYKKGFKNLWNTLFSDKHKKFKQFKLCLMNNKLFGRECGFGTTMSAKINNVCKKNIYVNKAKCIDKCIDNSCCGPNSYPFCSCSCNASTMNGGLCPNMFDPNPFNTSKYSLPSISQSFEPSERFTTG